MLGLNARYATRNRTRDVCSRDIALCERVGDVCARFPECAVRSRADEFGQRCAIVEHDDRNPAAYGNLRGIAVDELVAQSVDLQIAQRRMRPRSVTSRTESECANTDTYWVSATSCAAKCSAASEIAVTMRPSPCR